MSAPVSPAAAALRPGGLDPLRSLWALLTNVKFALFLVGLAALASFLGVVIPQEPGPMRTNPAARAAWLELRREDFGVFTHPMDRLGLFDLFHTWWFNGLWVVIIVAVTVCTVSRFRPVWRSVHRPPKAVGDRYFEGAHHRASFSHPGGVDAVEGMLRRRRYRVERTRSEAGTTWLFAERYSWSQYGTFVSHLALLLLLAGGVLTRFAGFERTLVVAETTPAAPVFADPQPGQLFVRMVDAVRGLDARGNVVDYRSLLEVRRGGQTVSCTATVNDPCQAFGYKVHQAAFFDDIGRLRITGTDGRVLYDDVLDFENRTTAVPLLRVTDGSGAVLYEQVLPQMATEAGLSAGPEDDYALSELDFPRTANADPGDTASVAVAWRVIKGQLHVAIPGDDGTPLELVPGQAMTVAGFRIEFREARSIPAMRIGDMPGAINADGSAVVQMLDGRDGSPYLWVSGIETGGTMVEEGTPLRTPAGYTYEFGGRVEASGLSVRRDPGGMFIWVAVAMAMVGLSVTFYVPRRRLWARVTPERTYLAGVAERTTRFSRELRQLGAALGANDALLPGDLSRD